MVIPCAVWAAAAAGIKLVGIPYPKPMHRFSPNFRVCLPQEDPRTDWFLECIWQQLKQVLHRLPKQVFKISGSLYNCLF